MSETKEPKPGHHDDTGECYDYVVHQSPGITVDQKNWYDSPGAHMAIVGAVILFIMCLLSLIYVSCDRDKLARDTAREIGKLKGQVYDAQIESENRLKANAALLLENTNLKKKVTILRDRQSQAGQIMYPTADLLKRLASMKFNDCIGPIEQNLKEIRETRKAMLNWLGIAPESPVKYVDGKPVKVIRKKK